MICPNFNDPLVKEQFDRLVAAVGENAAYNKWYYYDGNVPESEYKVPHTKVSNELLSTFPNLFQIGSSVLNLNRDPEDLDFISVDSDEDIANWLNTNNIPYNISDIDINFEYKGQNISIALDQQTKNFLDRIGVQNLNEFIEPNKKLVNLTLEYKKALGRDKDLQDLQEHYGFEKNIPSFQPKPGVEDLFDSNPELANQVYDALGIEVNNFKLIPNKEKHPEDANTYDILYKNEKIGVLALFEGKNKTIKGVKLEEKFRNKGLGKALYKWLNLQANLEGGVLYSDPEQQSESARRLWGSLIKEGVVNKATADEQSLKFNVNYKQQALQQYSQYLDTIFPDVILPIGTSGSGKSTFIKSLPQENLVVIEPDAMRVEFTGDINDKSKDKEIYEEAAKRAVAAIKQGKQVVFDTTNLTKDKRLPFIEAIKKEIPNANIQYKLMELNPELAKQRIKAQIARGENRANVPDSTIDRHAESYKQMLVDIKSEPITKFKELGNKQDIEGFKEFVNTQEYVDISFKAKPLNTISYLKQAELKGALKVGSKFSFSYWDEENGNITSYEDVTVKDIDPQKLIVELSDKTLKNFDLTNIIDDDIEGNLSFKEREILKKRLNIGDEEEVLLDSGRIKGIVVAVGKDGFVLKEENSGENINIKYSDIKRENHQIKFLQKVQEVKESINRQITIYGGKVRTEEQKVRLDSLKRAFSILEDAQQLEDLREFFEEVNENIANTQALIMSLPKNTDISSARKLYIIGYAKDFLDSFDSVDELNNLIQKYDGMSELKAVSSEFVSKIKDAKMDYYNIAVPQLADLLWEEFNPSINEELLKVNKTPWTKERLIEELRNPTRDLDSFNKFFVAPINSDDAITALFAKMIKRRKEIARAKDEMFLRKLVPVVKAVKDNFDYDEVVKSFYKLSTIVEEVDGEKKEKIVRKFIEQYNTSDYTNTLNNFYQELDIINNKISQMYSNGNFAEVDKLKIIRDAIQKEKTAYIKEFGKKVTAVDFKTEMESYRNFDNPKFYKYLDYYYEEVDEKDHKPETSIVLESKLESGKKTYYNYRDNRFTANKDKFQTQEYKELMQKDPLIVKLYTILKEEYDNANRAIPFSYRLNGIVPSMYETNFLNSITKSFENFWQSNQKQYNSKLDGKAYKEIPIGFTRVLDVSESSDDIVTSTLMFIAEANNYNAMHEYLGATDTIVEVLSKGNPLDETQKKVVKSEFNNRLDAIKKFISQIIYGEQNAYSNVMSKSIDALGKATAITRLGLNPLNWAQNFLIGNLTNLTEAIGSRHFNRSHLSWANAEFIKLQTTNPQKLANMIRSLDAIQGRFMKNFGDELLTFKEKYLSSDVLFLGQDIGEIQIQGTAMLALLKAKGIQIPEDGNFDLDKIPRDFVNLLHAINKHNHGVYNNFDRLYAQDNAFFRLFLQFRKFIVPTFRARYSGILSGQYRIDYESGTVEKGYYRLFYDFFRENLKNIADLKGLMANFNALSDVQKEGVRRTWVDIMAFTTMYVLVAMLKPGDDEEEELANWEWQIIYQAARLRGDIGNYLPILGLRDQLRIVNNPFAAAPLINNVLSLLGQVGDWEPDDEGNISIFKRYQRDTGMYEEGDLKILGKLEKINPFDNPLRVLYPKTMLENFEAASER